MFTTFAEFIFYCFTGEIETITNMCATFWINAGAFYMMFNVLLCCYILLKNIIKR